MSQDQKSLKQIIDFRIEKLNKLRDAGINPFPNKFDPTYKSESIKTDFDAMEPSWRSRRHNGSELADTNILDFPGNER